MIPDAVSQTAETTAEGQIPARVSERGFLNRGISIQPPVRGPDSQPRSGRPRGPISWSSPCGHPLATGKQVALRLVAPMDGRHLPSARHPDNSHEIEFCKDIIT